MYDLRIVSITYLFYLIIVTKQILKLFCQKIEIFFFYSLVVAILDAHSCRPLLTNYLSDITSEQTR